MDSANILAITGGGMMGRFSTQVLEGLEDARRQAIGLNGEPGLLDCFDVMAGTSAGALCVAGLLARKPAHELSRLFEDKGKAIFRSGKWATVRQLFRAKNDAAPLKSAIEEVIGDLYAKRLGEIEKTVVFPTFNESKGTPVILTNENPEHHNIKLGDAVMASAAAPTYFPAHRINGETGDRYIDGGIYANAPDIAAITIAMKKWHRLTLDRIYLLSIGTTNHAASPYDSNHRGNIGVWGWAAKPMARLLHVAMRGQVDHSTGLLTQLPLAMFCRIERELESDGDVSFALDNTDPKTMAALVDAGTEAVKKCLVGTNSDLRLVLARGK